MLDLCFIKLGTGRGLERTVMLTASSPFILFLEDVSRVRLGIMMRNVIAVAKIWKYRICHYQKQRKDRDIPGLQDYFSVMLILVFLIIIIDFLILTATIQVLRFGI